MPLKSCGPGHWKYGDSGHCYDNKKDAIKQGVAIEGPEKFAQVMKHEHSKGELSSLDYTLAKQTLFEELLRSETTAQTKNVKDSYDQIEKNSQETAADVKKINPKTHNIKDEDEDEENEIEKINLKTHHLEDEEVKGYVSQKKREELPSGDFGDPPYGFPVHDLKHWHAATKLIGRKSPSEQARIKKNLIRIGHKKGYPIPPDWESKAEEKKLLKKDPPKWTNEQIDKR